MNGISGCLAASPIIWVQSFCCYGQRHALTMDHAGIMEFPVACLLTMFCPFCFMVYSQAITELNVKLGGEKENIIMACLCAWCCFPCLIAQDAQSLDEMCQVRT